MLKIDIKERINIDKSINQLMYGVIIPDENQLFEIKMDDQLQSFGY